MPSSTDSPIVGNIRVFTSFWCPYYCRVSSDKFAISAIRVMPSKIDERSIIFLEKTFSEVLLSIEEHGKNFLMTFQFRLLHMSTKSFLFELSGYNIRCQIYWRTFFGPFSLKSLTYMLFLLLYINFWDDFITKFMWV